MACAAWTEGGRTSAPGRELGLAYAGVSVRCALMLRAAPVAAPRGSWRAVGGCT